MHKRLGSSATVRKNMKSSSHKSSNDRIANLDKFSQMKTKHVNLTPGYRKDAVLERGNWDAVNPVIPDEMTIFNKHRGDCVTHTEKYSSDNSILTQDTYIAKLKASAKAKTNLNVASLDHRVANGKRGGKELVPESLDSNEINETKSDESAFQLERDLVECHSTLRLLKSDTDAAERKLLEEITSLKEELSREVSMRSTLENSQTALVKLVQEMETLLDAEREKGCNLTSNCSNLKQDSTHWQTVFKQEQQFRQEFQQKYSELNSEREKMFEMCQNLQSDKNLLLAETEKLQAQYTSLIKQLDEINAAFDERKLTEDQLEEENKRLNSTVDHLNKLLNERQEKLTMYNDAFDCTDVPQLKDRLKESVHDVHLYQQRCNQLHHHIDDLKKELQSKDEEMAEKEKTLYQEMDELRKSITNAEVENEKSIRDKNCLIEKLEHSAETLTREKSDLMTQLHETELELEGKRSNCRQLEQEKQLLCGSIEDLKAQQKSQSYFEQSLNDLTEQKTKLSYDNGLLTCRLEQLHAELTKMPNIVAELRQLKKNATATDAKNIKLQSELVASKTLVQKLASELETLKSNWDKEQMNMDAMVAARDKVNGEKQKLVDEINRIREEHLRTVDGLQKSVAVAKQDNTNLSAMLETIMRSHSGLQTSVESIQVEQAKKDCLIEQLKEKNKELCSIREHLEADLAAAETRLIVCREFEDAELAPVKRELVKVKDDYKRLVASMDTLLISNKKFKMEVEQHQDEVNKRTCAIDNLKEERQTKDREYSQQKRHLEESIKNLKEQLSQERDSAQKKVNHEKLEKNSQIDELRRKNNELDDNISQLQSKNKELDYRLKEEKLKTATMLKEKENFDELNAKHTETEANLQILTDHVTEMERTNDEYLKKNNEQAVMLEKFMSVVLELQTEIKSLGHVNASLVDSNRQLEELNRSQNVKRSKSEVYSNVDAIDEEILREIKKLVQTVELGSKRKTKHEKKKASESVQRATTLMEASRKTIAYLTDVAESSHSEVDVEMKMLRQQLDNEQSHARTFEHKLAQVQESSLRHTEQLAKELDLLRSSAGLLYKSHDTDSRQSLSAINLM